MMEILKNRLFIASLVGAIILIGLTQLVSDEDRHPCSPTQYPGKCYRITRDICTQSWDKYEKECQAKVNQLNLSPSRITGPIVFNCQISRLDQFFGYLRVTSPECDEQQQKLDLWKKTNPDF